MISLGSSDYDEITDAADLTGDPTIDGYRHVKTLYTNELPFKVGLPQKGDNPNYGVENYVFWSLVCFHNNPEVGFSQVESAVTSLLPGTEASASIGGLIPALFGFKTSASPASYYQEVVPSKGNPEYFSHFVWFCYLVDVAGEAKPVYIKTGTLLHPNETFEIDYGGSTKAMTIAQKLAIVVEYYPNDPRFKTSLGGFTPTESWHPDDDHSMGVGEVRLYNKTGDDLLVSFTDWTAVITSIRVPNLA